MNNQDKINMWIKSTCRAWELVEKASKITLLTHSKPDGDGVASCLALELVLTKLGKQVETVYPDSPEFNFKSQPKNVLIGKHKQTPDLIISCDTANYERLYYPDSFKGIDLINIDHHVSNSIDGTFNFIDPEASSASEVLVDLLNSWKQDIDKEVASALLFGIVYDSRVFHTQSTHASTLRIAADLMDKGADLFKLKCELLSNKDPEIVKLWTLVLDRIQLSDSKKSVWSYLTQDDLKKFCLTLTSIVGFNDFLTDLSGVDVTLLFYETDDGKTKISLRSKEYDVNKLATQFGGGGHKNASGILSDKSLQDLMGEVVNVLP